jgi:hypothetical protein
MTSYVFILCPPYCGSTLLWRLIGTSDAVSCLPEEGQFLPEVRELMRRDPWNDDVELPWERIKTAWHRYWDAGKPLLIEKSPPNLLRAHSIAEHFDPVAFVVMVRDPYAHCEGLMRRNKWEARRAAEFSLRCLERQKANAETLTAILRFTYEELVSDPRRICADLATFLPDLGALDYRRTFTLQAFDGEVERPLENLNERKVSRLSPADLGQITSVLAARPDLLSFWGYGFR